ncbi:MAG: HD domain-containing protein [Campylobacterales bacterium]
MHTNLEELISSHKSKKETFKALKGYLKEYKNSLGSTPINSASIFLYKHTKMIDHFITFLYKISARECFLNFLPLSSNIPLTVVALGSYGREELCIYSDIDIMIVYKDIKGYNTTPLIEGILYGSWDSGLKLGHRVHEISELQEAARSDITIKSAMIEGRYICGSKPLWFEVENEIVKIRKESKKEFIKDKIDEYERRHKKNPLALEPNIKECSGGLRDANTLFWILNTMYNINSLKEAVGIVYDERSYREFKQAYEFIQKTRIALHQIKGKKNDTLSFELIPELAKATNIERKSDKMAQFAFSKKLLESLNGVESFCQIAICKASKSFFATKSIKELRSKRDEKGIYIIEDKAYRAFNKKPLKAKEVVDIFIDLPDKDIKLGASLLELVKNCKVPRVQDRELYKRFAQIMSRENSYEILKLFFRGELLQILLPPFKKILNLPQFDGYHHYPVDIHTINNIKMLENIQNQEVRDIYEGFSKKEKLLLRFLLLFHDIGKGRVQDHHRLGRNIWIKYAKNYGFTQNEIKLGAKLILCHTLMSKTAQGEDIYNENRILLFASKIEDKKSLEFLYVMTHCDMRAVGENVLNHFIEKLLHDLFLNTISALENRGLIDETKQRIKKEEIIKKSEAFNSLEPKLQKKLLELDVNMLFIKHKSNEIVEMVKRAQNIQTYSYDITHNSLLIIEIYKKTALNLGYLLGKLSYLNIASMDVFRLQDGVKYFKIEFHEKAEDDDVMMMHQLIEDSFDMSKEVSLNKPTIKKRDITLNQNHSRTLAEVKVKAKDQKGLLAYIATVFDSLNIEIVSAKVHTQKGVANDLFLIEKNGSFWNNKEKVITKITG